MVTSVFQINHVWISIKKYFYILLYAVPCSLVDFARSSFWLLDERFLVLLGLLTPVPGAALVGLPRRPDFCCQRPVQAHEQERATRFSSSRALISFEIVFPG
jgi:hypothetical protein